jgi:hypothetical protein
MNTETAETVKKELGCLDQFIGTENYYQQPIVFWRLEVKAGFFVLKWKIRPPMLLAMQRSLTAPCPSIP